MLIADLINSFLETKERERLQFYRFTFSVMPNDDHVAARIIVCLAFINLFDILAWLPRNEEERVN